MPLLSFCLLAALAADETAFQPAPIQVPERITVELAAGPPLVKHPMMAGFDDKGRLYIAESAGQNLRRAELEKELPNFVRRLEDVDGDGKFDKSTIFADKLTLPQGALWHDGALYVAAPPYIWRFEDTDDDGVADKRDKLVSEFGYTGNAASIHGCFLGPCGRIYWCDGRHGHEYESDDGTVKSKGKAARIFSCRPDGKDLRVHCGGGMDNPVEIDFTPRGEILGTVNLFYKQRGDCLVHWMHGGNYPRFDQQAVVAEFPRTGDLLREVLNLGHVAVSGTCRVRGTGLGKELQDCHFITEFNTHKVVFARLERDGSTFRTKKEEFLESTSNDFHPTDVLEDADGSLLVIDTGGWFRIGCPTSQIAKPNILGAIYRVRKTGEKPPADPRGLNINWSGPETELAKHLDDSRPFVADRAVRELARRGEPSVAALAEVLRMGEEDNRRQAVWTLSRIGSSQARELLRKSLADEAASVRQASARSLGVLRDQKAVAALNEMVVQDDPPVRRQAATALGQIGQPLGATGLLSALALDNDRVLEHALIYGLIEINEPYVTSTALKSPSPKVRRAALIALDQMKSGELTQRQVAELLDTDDVNLRAAALDVISRHESWTDEVVGLVRGLLARPKLDARQQAELRGLLIAFAKDEAIQEISGRPLAAGKLSPDAARVVLEAIARSGLPPESVSIDWTQSVSAALGSYDANFLRQAVATSRALGFETFLEPLNKIAGSDHPLDVRVEAAAAYCASGRAIEGKVFDLLAGQLGDDVPPLRRLTAARAIGQASLSKDQRRAALKLIAQAGPLELPPLLPALRGGRDAKEGAELAAVLEKSPGLASLSAGAIREAFSTYPKEARQAAEPLLEKIRSAGREQRAHLDALEKSAVEGDAARGREIFLSKKTSCAACHRVGKQGGLVGPDLSAIGSRRSLRDLLEAVVYPSSSLARGFESYSIATDDGKVHAGLILRETADSVYIRTADQTELRLARDKIEEMSPSPTSIMPAGLEKTMTAEQLQDLTAYLRTLK